jgi:NAD(P) transhydrogenase subunit alpha
MKIGFPKETRARETRVAVTPDTIKKYIKKNIEVWVERGAGLGSGIQDSDFEKEGAKIGSTQDIWNCQIIGKIHPPLSNELSLVSQKGTLIVSLMEPYQTHTHLIPELAQKGINSVALELIPRTSRAQSMDVLSSQAGIAGYRAVLEAAIQYPRFFPLMMTSAGSSRPAKLIVLGVGVAGLQAIATAKRLGAQVEAYDVRAETKEQVLSLGAKFLDLEVKLEGSGQGGYARELSAEDKTRQQALLGEKLKKYDVIVTTANIPGRKAPLLVSDDAINGMRSGSVVIDMAAGNGGNCNLSKPDETITHNGVKIVGITNFPALVGADASSFFGRNIFNLLELFIKSETNTLHYPLEDDIVAAALVTLNGQIRIKL